MIKKISLLSFMMIILFSSFYAYDLNILEETPEFIKIEILLDDVKVTKNDQFTSIFLKKGVSIDDAGAPNIPVIKLDFAVPENGSIDFSMNSFNHKTVKIDNEIVPIITQKEIFKDGDINNPEIITEYIVDELKYNQKRNLYTISPKQSLNYYDIISVIINPIVYDRTFKQLNYPEKIVLNVNIRGDFPKSFSDESNGLFKDFIVNNKYGLSFKQKREKDFYTSRFSRFPIWYKMEINNEGIYVLDRDFLNQLPLADIDPRTLRIFSTGGAMLPNYYTEPGLPFSEIPILVTGEEDGSFDVGDKVIFYAQSRDGLGKNLPLASYTGTSSNIVFDELGDYHYFNPYSQNGVYWLTWGSDNNNPPSRMQQSNFINSEIVRDYGRIVTHYEEANIRRDIHGFNWFTLLMSGVVYSEYTFDVSLNNLVNTEDQILEIVLQGNDSSSKRVSVKAGNEQIMSFNFSGTSMIKRINNGDFFSSGINTISFQKNTGKNIYLKYFNIQWYQTLVKNNQTLSFLNHKDDDNLRVKYIFDNPQNQSVRAYQVNAFNDVKSLSVTDNYFIGNGDDNTKFFVCSDNDYLQPLNIEQKSLQILDDDAPQHNVLIIYADEFIDGANRMSQIYQDSYQYNTLLVNQQSVFDNFSGGHPDPIAIRNYLQYLQFNCPEPKPLGALLIGAGTLDYRNFYGKSVTKNFLITNQVNTYSLDPDHNINTTDDYYAHLTQSASPEIIIGRIPAKNVQELNNYIDKLEDYFINPKPGLWQYQFQIIADDHIGNSGNDEHSHTDACQLTANLIEDNIMIDKLLAMEFEMDAFRRKPQVRNLLINKINEGRLYWYYNGHGAYDNLGDEKYFRGNTDLPSLTNYQRYPIFVAASCNVGEYDNPNYNSLTEDLLMLKNAGSIISIGATRTSMGSTNSNLFKIYFDEVINLQKSVGEGLLYAKLRTNSPTNNKKYNILGDPFLKAKYPIVSENILINPESDTLRQRQIVNFEGDFGEINLHKSVQSFVYDSGQKYILTSPDGASSTEEYITKDNLPLFNGISTLSAGQYTSSFIVPDDAYIGDNGKIISFTVDSINNKTYINKRLNLNFIDEAIAVENDGKPNIELYVDNLDFVPGDIVSPNPSLIAKISDENGINVLGKSGHNILVVIDNNEPLVVTEGFIYDIDSYTSGTLVWQLVGLEPGMHNLQLIAYDNFNEVSISETWFVTTEKVPIKIQNALVYPNPIKQDGYFTFDLSHNADIIINIFTITGRKIQTLKSLGHKTGYNQIFWNGKDIDGDKLANNTYFYTIQAKSIDAEGSVSITDKFIILK
ncbi:MAG: type IX secretion system sortase PorU [Candidatus Cloacimonetes bacterium]|nr:type IX secretion system sortase PorU [Candidatus Cloacimonadota bacterium]